MEDPILAVTDGQNLQNITLRLSKEEAEACLTRLMGFTTAPKPTWPLITALGQVVYADRLGPLPRSIGVIKFDVDTSAIRRKLEELRAKSSEEPSDSENSDDEDGRFELWSGQSNVDKETEPDEAGCRMGQVCEDPFDHFCGWVRSRLCIGPGEQSAGWIRALSAGGQWFVADKDKSVWFQEGGDFYPWTRTLSTVEQLLDLPESVWANPTHKNAPAGPIVDEAEDASQSADDEEAHLEEWLSRNPLNTSEPKQSAAEPAEQESASSTETPDSSRPEVSQHGKPVRLSVEKVLLAVNHITKSAALACELSGMTQDDYALLKLWLKRSFDCTTNALGRSNGVSVEQLKERIRAQSVAGTLIIENYGLSPTVLTKGKAAPAVKPIDLVSAGCDDEPKAVPNIPQVLLPGRVIEVCKSRRATGVLESRLLEAFIQSGQKVTTFIAGLPRLQGMVVVP